VSEPDRRRRGDRRLGPDLVWGQAVYVNVVLLHFVMVITGIATGVFAVLIASGVTR
jgi:hypothetical protein